MQSTDSFNPHVIAATEELAHFVWRDKVKLLLNTMTGQVKYKAFMPRMGKEGGRWELSTYRTVGLSDADVVSLGQQVAGLAHKALYGDVTVDVRDLVDRGLVLDPDNRPIVRHTNIYGWPEEKDAHQSLAIDLARCARPRVLIP